MLNFKSWMWRTRHIILPSTSPVIPPLQFHLLLLSFTSSYNFIKYDLLRLVSSPWLYHPVNDVLLSKSVSIFCIESHSELTSSRDSLLFTQWFALSSIVYCASFHFLSFHLNMVACFSNDWWFYSHHLLSIYYYMLGMMLSVFYSFSHLIFTVVLMK